MMNTLHRRVEELKRSANGDTWNKITTFKTHPWFEAFLDLEEMSKLTELPYLRILFVSEQT